MPESQPDTQERRRLTLAIAVLEQMITLGTAGLGLVAALAWNEVIKAAFTVYFPRPEDSLFAQFGYAVVVTAIVVIVTINLTRTVSRLKDRLGERTTK